MSPFKGDPVYITTDGKMTCEQIVADLNAKGNMLTLEQLVLFNFGPDAQVDEYKDFIPRRGTQVVIGFEMNFVNRFEVSDNGGRTAQSTDSGPVVSTPIPISTPERSDPGRMRKDDYLRGVDAEFDRTADANEVDELNAKKSFANRQTYLTQGQANIDTPELDSYKQFESDAKWAQEYIANHGDEYYDASDLEIRRALSILNAKGNMDRMEEAKRLRDRGAELGDPTGGRILGGIGWCLSYHNPLSIFEQLGALGLSPSAEPVIVKQTPLRQDGRYQLVEFRTPSGTSTGVLDTKGSLFGGLIPVTITERKALEKGELTPQGLAAERSVEPPVPAGSCIVYRGERPGEWIAYGPDMRPLDVTIFAASEAEARAKANEWFHKNNPDLAEEIYTHPEFEIQRVPEENARHDDLMIMDYEPRTEQQETYELSVEPVRAFERYNPITYDENEVTIGIRARDFLRTFEADYLAPILAKPYVECNSSENQISVARLPFESVESGEVAKRIAAQRVLEKRISKEDLELFSDRWHNRTNCVFSSSLFPGRDALTWGRMTEDFVASNGRVVHEITTSAETAIEGKTLKHCVKAAGYDRACARDGLTRLYSLPVDGVPNSTVELKIIKSNASESERVGLTYISKPLGPKKDFRLGIVQHQAYMDSEPSPEAKAALREWMAAVESGNLKLNIDSINDVKGKLAEIEVENSESKVKYAKVFEDLVWSESGVVPTAEWEQQATDFIKRNWVVERGVETRFERVMPDGSVITATITGKDDKGQNIYRWTDASGLHVDDHVAQTAVTTRVVRTRNLLSFFEGPGTQSIIQEGPGAVGMNSKLLRVTNPGEAPVFQYPIEKFSDIGKYDQ